MTGTLTDDEKLARLRLIRTENVGPITFNRLIDRYDNAVRALAALPDLAKRGGRMEGLKPCDKDIAEREMAQAAKIKARMIFKGETLYPALLAEVEDAPPVITVLGDPAMIAKPALGVVGARNASLAGRKIAESFSSKVAQGGYVIISGLARGIDSAAHQVSLKTGTVAVVAGGIDVVYPPENKKLYDEIAAQGAIVAESPFGAEPMARHFPRRNRIISGLSHGVLVVEAAEKSGSLITARMALEQNREVFAVPGSPLDPRAGGTNRLLRDGNAHVTTSAEDILQVLQSLKLQPLQESAAEWEGAPASIDAAQEPDDALREKVLETLSPAPVSVDEVIRALQAPAGYILTIILELELAGKIERHPGNKVNLI